MRLPPKIDPAATAASAGASTPEPAPVLIPVLILGASGRIGQVLRQTCAAAAGRPDLLWRWQARRAPQNKPQNAPETGTENWHLLDPLAMPDALAQAARGTRAILCLAGPVPGGRAGATAEPELLRQHSTLALATLEAAARAAEQTGRPPHVFLASSAAVYGAATGLLREDQPLMPLSPYGRAKAEMEQAALARAAELGLPLTQLRIGNIAGLDAILGGWRPGFCLDRFPTGLSPQRSYIGAARLAEVLIWLLRTGARADGDTPQPALPQVLNIAQPGPVEMAALLRAADLPYDTRPAPTGALPEVALDVSRLIRLLAPKATSAPPPRAKPALPQADPAELVAEARALQLLPAR